MSFEVENNNPLPRYVYIQLGMPEEMRDGDGPELEKGLNLDDCFMLDFSEAGQDGTITGGGFSLFSTCLCMLPALTEAWLMGKEEAEIEAMFAGHKHET